MLAITLIFAALTQQLSGLTQQFETIAQEARGKVGVAAVVLETGESAGLQTGEKFPMQSVYKLPIGMAVLAKVDRGELKLEQKIRVTRAEMAPGDSHSPLRDKYPEGDVDFTIAELINAAVSVSDNTACDVLIPLAGGGEAITKQLRDFGINDLVVANTEREMGANNALQYLNFATPEAAIKLLRFVQEGSGLSATSREFLLEAMRETSTGPKRMKGLLPPDAVVAHKTGTSSKACNDIGIVTLPDGKHLAIAVFVADASADMAAREGVIAKITRAAWDHWTAKPAK